jgi:hypothetical protein
MQRRRRNQRRRKQRAAARIAPTYGFIWRGADFSGERRFISAQLVLERRLELQRQRSLVGHKSHLG